MFDSIALRVYYSHICNQNIKLLSTAKLHVTNGETIGEEAVHRTCTTMSIHYYGL